MAVIPGSRPGVGPFRQVHTVLTACPLTSPNANRWQLTQPHLCIDNALKKTITKSISTLRKAFSETQKGKSLEERRQCRVSQCLFATVAYCSKHYPMSNLTDSAAHPLQEELLQALQHQGQASSAQTSLPVAKTALLSHLHRTALPLKGEL